jgi:hypothetical protein
MTKQVADATNQINNPTSDVVDTSPEETSKSKEHVAASPERPAPRVEDVPPNGGWGWVNVACIFTINAHTWGLNSVRPAPCLVYAAAPAAAIAVPR